MSSPTYFGKYRAVVVDVNDPQKRGRVRVQCPKVLGDAKSSWCETCVQVAGDDEGDFCLPTVGETVWVEFEEGNANKPVMAGGWYSSGKSPAGDYGEAQNERIISFRGAKISMRSGQCTVSTADSSVLLKEDHVTISTDGFQADPSSDPVSKVKVNVAKDDIALSVDDGQVKMDVKKDEISFDFKGGNCTGKVSQDSIELVCAGGTSKVTLSQNKITVEAQGVSCDFTSDSLTKLNNMIN